MELIDEHVYPKWEMGKTAPNIIRQKHKLIEDKGSLKFLVSLILKEHNMRLSFIRMVVVLFFVLISCTFAIGSDYNYKIGPGDVIEISVWKDESLNRKLAVPPDGIIAFPLIGDINIKGMTVKDIRNTITERLDIYIKDAVVTVMLIEINSMRAYVIGKVNQPGAYPILMDTSVVQMLSMAGGLNPFASEKNIHILRTVNNTTTRIPFNYREVLKGANLEQNIVLQQGDVIVVP